MDCVSLRIYSIYIIFFSYPGLYHVSQYMVFVYKVSHTQLHQTVPAVRPPRKARDVNGKIKICIKSSAFEIILATIGFKYYNIKTQSCGQHQIASTYCTTNHRDYFFNTTITPLHHFKNFIQLWVAEARHIDSVDACVRQLFLCH